MKVIYNDEKTYILCFDRGEDVMAELQKFCTNKNIRAGFFWGIGAAERVSLAEYSLEKKEYQTVEHPEPLEIASFTGNIAVAEGNIMLHAHGVFSTLKKVYAGHVQKMTVGVTCEITLTALPGEMKREYSEEIGLKLLV
jgi:predicted DNA-binding protein with PD1-like motif